MLQVLFFRLVSYCNCWRSNKDSDLMGFWSTKTYIIPYCKGYM